jgi:uncharacterized protein (DUF2141 family)
MKHLLSSLSLVSILLAQFSIAAELTVTVSDVRATSGHVLIAVFDSTEAWNENAEPIAKGSISATAGDVVFRFLDLSAGTYAVTVTHDENDNGKIDSNLVGIPTEGYGFSNDPQVMRRATFEEAAFVVGAADTAIRLRMR